MPNRRIALTLLVALTWLVSAYHTPEVRRFAENRFATSPAPDF